MPCLELLKQIDQHRSPPLSTYPSSFPSNQRDTSSACLLTPQILAVFTLPCVPTDPAILAALLSTSPGELGDEVCEDPMRGVWLWLWIEEGEGPIATNINPEERARMHIIPNSSCSVIALRSLPVLSPSLELVFVLD